MKTFFTSVVKRGKFYFAFRHSSLTHRQTAEVVVRPLHGLFVKFIGICASNDGNMHSKQTKTGRLTLMYCDESALIDSIEEQCQPAVMGKVDFKKLTFSYCFCLVTVKV